MSRIRNRRLVAAVVGAAAAATFTSGCQFQGVYDLPLPGGEAAGRDAYRVTIEFRDVLDLVPKSSVRVNDVPVGEVEKVTLDGWTAKVRVRVKDSVQLPDNAEARIRQTSLLGEKFVSLQPPAGVKGQGRLSDGDVIPLARSSRNTEIEEVLGALSLLLNGGGVAQLKTISVELNRVMEGREDNIKAFLEQLDTFMAGLDGQKADIIRALEGTNRLAASLNAQRGTIADAVDQIGPGLKILADQREQLVAMLEALSELGAVSARVVRQSKDNTVADLRALTPILGKLAEAGSSLPKALEQLVTYPFPDAAVDAIKGDYTNLDAQVRLDLRMIAGNLQGDPGGDGGGDDGDRGLLGELLDPGLVPDTRLRDLGGGSGSRSLNPSLDDLLIGGLR